MRQNIVVRLLGYPSIDRSFIAYARFDHQMLVLLPLYAIAYSYNVAYSTTGRTLGPLSNPIPGRVTASIL